jgi:hypothetical protein
LRDDVEPWGGSQGLLGDAPSIAGEKAFVGTGENLLPAKTVGHDDEEVLCFRRTAGYDKRGPQKEAAGTTHERHVLQTPDQERDGIRTR